MAKKPTTMRMEQSLIHRANKLIDYLSAADPFKRGFTRTDVIHLALDLGLQSLEKKFGLIATDDKNGRQPKKGVRRAGPPPRPRIPPKGGKDE